MEPSSLYTQFANSGKLLDVEVEGVQILLPTSDKIAIGTKGLNGCTCVVILGSAIIMAHISPIPGRFSQLVNSKADLPKASHDHHESLLARIKSLHNDNLKHFPPKSTAWGIFSVGPDGSMKTVETQVRNALGTIGYNMNAEVYQEINPILFKSPKGEVVAYMRGNERLLFLEKRQIWPRMPEPKASPSKPQEPLVSAASPA